MIKRHVRRNSSTASSSGIKNNTSFSQLVDCFDAERLAQQEEFLKREKEHKKQNENKKRPPKQSQPKKPNKFSKTKGMSFEEKLDLTYQWLEETFPHLFATDDYIPLDILILRDLKVDYKNNRIKKGYPEDLVIKAALSRYRESLGYLECIREGACRYNLKGEVSGIVTREEEEAAKKILITL